MNLSVLVVFCLFFLGGRGYANPNSDLRELCDEEEDEDADEEAGGLVGVLVPGLVLVAGPHDRSAALQLAGALGRLQKSGG